MIDRLQSILRPGVGTDLKLTGVALFFAKLFGEHDTRIVDLEARQLQKGDKGEKGDPGRDGVDGRDGVAGRDGIDGKDGKDGKAGKAGKDGISVVDSEIAADNHLVFKLSDGRIIDAGPLPEADSNGVFVSGNAWQVTVSATAPSNPALNDLWYDIS